MTPLLRRALSVLAVLVIVLGLVACGGDDDRPAVADWEPVWLATQAMVPGDAEIAEAGEDACGPVLGDLRASREELLPAPTGALDEHTRAWLAAAEGLMLDCPTDADERGAAIEELDRLAGRIETGIDVVEG